MTWPPLLPYFQKLPSASHWKENLNSDYSTFLQVLLSVTLRQTVNTDHFYNYGIFLSVSAQFPFVHTPAVLHWSDGVQVEHRSNIWTSCQTQIFEREYITWDTYHDNIKIKLNDMRQCGTDLLVNTVKEFRIAWKGKSSIIYCILTSKEYLLHAHNYVWIIP